MRTQETLQVLGWRTGLAQRVDGQPSPSGRLAILAGDEERLLDPDGDKRIESAGKLARLSLVPGPDGGYRGVEAEEATEDEPGLWLAVADLARTGTTPGKTRFDDGIYASLSTGSAAWIGLRTLIGQGEVVDLDLQPAAGLALATVSRGGGVGELMTIDVGGSPRPAIRALSRAAVATIALRDAPFTAMGPRSGAAALAAAFQPSRARPIGILVGLGVVAGALLIWLRYRRRRG
jgi:hypothetical protein